MIKQLCRIKGMQTLSKSDQNGIFGKGLNTAVLKGCGERKWGHVAKSSHTFSPLTGHYNISKWHKNLGLHGLSP